MKSDHMLEEQRCSLVSRDILGTGDKMGHFGEMVYNTKSGVKLVRLREVSNKVHGNGLPLSSRDRKR
jgi:hypothetical protein